MKWKEVTDSYRVVYYAPYYSIQRRTNYLDIFPFWGTVYYTHDLEELEKEYKKIVG